MVLQTRIFNISNQSPQIKTFKRQTSVWSVCEEQTMEGPWYDLIECDFDLIS